MQWRVWYNLILLRCSFAAFEGPSSAGPWGGRKVGAGSAAPLWSLHLGLLSAWFIHLQIQFPPCTTLTSSASDLAYPSLANWALCPTEFHLKCSFLTFMRLSFLIDPQWRPLWPLWKFICTWRCSRYRAMENALFPWQINPGSSGAFVLNGSMQRKRQKEQAGCKRFYNLSSSHSQEIRQNMITKAVGFSGGR